MRVRRTHNRRQAREARSAAMAGRGADDFEIIMDRWLPSRTITHNLPTVSRILDLEEMRSWDGGGERMSLFGAQIGERFETEILRQAGLVSEGQELVAGYASVTEVAYELYDAFGAYDETIEKGAFGKSLALINAGLAEITHTLDHRVGMATMASGRLSVGEDDRGLWMVSRLSMDESDAALYIAKMRNESIPGQMSMMGWIREWSWNEDYDALRVHEWDLADGDVASLMLYGANPNTSEVVMDSEGKPEKGERDAPESEVAVADMWDDFSVFTW